MTRRAALAAMALLPAAATPLASEAAEPSATPDAWSFTFPSLDGGNLAFNNLRGRVLLVVNTASFCGYAPQFRGLEALHRDRGSNGLTVIGMPSNDFYQEAETDAKVKELCELTYGVEFPMTSLTHVAGRLANPFYTWVRDVRDGWHPTWNFNKVLIGRDGRIRELYRADVEPDSKQLQAALGTALATS